MSKINDEAKAFEGYALEKPIRPDLELNFLWCARNESNCGIPESCVMEGDGGTI